MLHNETLFRKKPLARVTDRYGTEEKPVFICDFSPPGAETRR